MESDYSDEDEYLPITAGAWGDQARQQNQDDNEGDENTHYDPTKSDTDGWSGLIDPEAKKTAGAIGSGGLHRKGKNYKPVSEEHIIKQRKGVVIPKSKDTKKTRVPRSGSTQTTPTHSTSHRSFSRPTKTKPLTTTNFSKPKHQQAPSVHPAPPPPPPPSTIRRPPPPSSSGQSGWGAQPLVETPFWEKKDNTTPSAQSRHGPSQQQNDTNQWGSWGSQSVIGATKRPSAPGYNDHSPTTTTTLSPPPGFGPIPQRQYPVKSNSKSQPRPPPGFSYSEKPAWGTSSTQSSDRINNNNNNNNAQLHSWNTNDESKELWRRMEEGTQITNQTTNNESNVANNNNNNSQLHVWTTNDESKELWRRMEEGTQATNQTTNNESNVGSNNSNLDWVSGWDDLSLNNQKATPPPRPSAASQGSNGRVAATTFSATDTGGWGSAPTTNDTGGWGTAASPTNNNRNNGQWESPTATDSTHESLDDTATTTSPMQFLDQQMAGYSRGRFSDPSKNKYSSTMTAMDHNTGNKHLPKNYYTCNGTSRPAFMDAPHRVAQPPPSHNPVVILIHLELENGAKMPIPIRKLDNPQALAQTFCQSQNITNPTMINGISDLFAQQKSTAMKRYSRT